MSKSEDKFELDSDYDSDGVEKEQEQEQDDSSISFTSDLQTQLFDDVDSEYSDNLLI